jgi:polyisoprenoid-binding protein YceI
MKKATSLLAASMFAATTGSAFAAWEPILIGTTTQQLYQAETAGKSGNVKACFQATVTTNTFQWTHTQTGNTRGTFTETSTTDQVQVANSLCEPQ